jgi:hypothetical protein
MSRRSITYTAGEQYQKWYELEWLNYGEWVSVTASRDFPTPMTFRTREAAKEYADDLSRSREIAVRVVEVTP